MAAYHENRAGRAEAALETYAKALGEGHRPLDLDHVRDLMQDMIHWIAKEDEVDEDSAVATFNELATTAATDFPMELAESEDR